MSRTYYSLGLALAALAGGCDVNPYVGTAKSETALVQYSSCDALETDLKDMLIAEVEATFDQQRYWNTRWGGGVMTDGTAPTAGTGTNAPPRQEGVDYSGTNNQEKGVDESDFVKTDGYHVYVINGNQLHIFGVPQFGQLVPESTVTLEGWPRELLVHSATNRAVVFSQVQADTLPAEHPLRQKIGRQVGAIWYWRVPTISKVTVLDITDRTAPKLVREVFLEGGYQTARLVDTTVRLGVYTWLTIPGLDEWYWGWGWGANVSLDQREAGAKAMVRGLSLDDIVPIVYERLPDRTFATHKLTENQCATFYRPEDSQARGVTSLLSLDLAASTLKVNTTQVVTNNALLYASTSYLYLVENAHDWWWFWWNMYQDDQLNVHGFDISTAGQTSYVGSGRVPGMIKDTFSLSEYQGFLRVATTTNWETRWWLPPNQRPATENHVWVLQSSAGRDVPNPAGVGLGYPRMAKVGHLGGIAPGERIFATRFAADKGFMVTFRQVDPLFTLDLSNPYLPRVVGSLSTPGVSNYIQPIADGRLLTIGWGGDAQGLNWKTQIGLFDASDFAHPRLQDTQNLSISGSWTWSSAMYEHKAFQYWAPKKLLAVPVSSYWSYVTPGGYYNWSYTSHLMLVTVDTQTGLSLYGDIDHSAFYNSDATRYWNYTDIERSIFMGDFIYAISDRGITVHRTADLSLVTSQPLPGYLPNNWWWWW